MHDIDINFSKVFGLLLNTSNNIYELYHTGNISANHEPDSHVDLWNK